MTKLYLKVTQEFLRREASSFPHGESFADALRGAILQGVPELRDKLFRVDFKKNLGQAGAVFITYSNVPRGSSELDALNGKPNLMLSVSAPRGDWTVSGPVPDLVKVEQFRGFPRKWFRAKSGTPEATVKYLHDWFVKMKASLVPELKKSWGDNEDVDAV